MEDSRPPGSVLTHSHPDELAIERVPNDIAELVDGSYLPEAPVSAPPYQLDDYRLFTSFREPAAELVQLAPTAPQAAPPTATLADRFVRRGETPQGVTGIDWSEGVVGTAGTVEADHASEALLAVAAPVPVGEAPVLPDEEPETWYGDLDATHNMLFGELVELHPEPEQVLAERADNLINSLAEVLVEPEPGQGLSVHEQAEVVALLRKTRPSILDDARKRVQAFLAEAARQATSTHKKTDAHKLTERTVDQLTALGDWLAGGGALADQIAKKQAASRSDASLRRAAKRDLKTRGEYPATAHETDAWRDDDPSVVLATLLQTRYLEGMEPIRDQQHVRLVLRESIGGLRAPDGSRMWAGQMDRGLSPEQNAQLKAYERQVKAVDKLEAQVAKDTREAMKGLQPRDLHVQLERYDDYYEHIAARFGTDKVSVSDARIMDVLYPTDPSRAELSLPGDKSGLTAEQRAEREAQWFRQLNKTQQLAVVTVRECLYKARENEIDRLRVKAGVGPVIGAVVLGSVPQPQPTEGYTVTVSDNQGRRQVPMPADKLYTLEDIDDLSLGSDGHEDAELALTQAQVEADALAQARAEAQAEADARQGFVREYTGGEMWVDPYDHSKGTQPAYIEVKLDMSRGEKKQPSRFTPVAIAQVVSARLLSVKMALYERAAARAEALGDYAATDRIVRTAQIAGFVAVLTGLVVDRLTGTSHDYTDMFPGSNTVYGSTMDTSGR